MRIQYEVKSSTAARAVFQEGRGKLSKIALTFQTFDGDEVSFELDMFEAASLIDQATAAYNAALPTLKSRRMF